MTSIYVDVTSFPDVGQFWPFLYKYYRAFGGSTKAKGTINIEVRVSSLTCTSF